jgi:asparagine synthase (glutamine-hydrolysing)
MGVIYGYISLTDKPVDPEVVETMRKANSFWGPDGDGMFINENAALGSLILFNTPEAIFEKQPIYFEDNHKVMVATARIDNRDDLCRAFNIPLSARDIYPDSYYMRLAYEKWGEECPDHLIGDWCFAVYDKVTRKLFIARDHHGINALYYYKGRDFFVFSSSLKGILCLPQVPKKENEYKIAQILVNVNEGGPQTCYLDIFRLPPAHTLKVVSTIVTTNRYWYLERTPEIHLKNDQEYIDRFRELYTEAVRCRLRSYRPVGATLSGGLDSGSLCILASQELAKYSKRLPAFTSVPIYDVPWPKNRIGNEGQLALALAEKLGNVDVTLCQSEDIGPLKGIKIMTEIFNQPVFVPNNAYWLCNILNISSNSGIGALLICQSGNLTITWPSNSLQKIYNDKKFIRILNSFRQFISFHLSLNKLIINKNLLLKYSIYKSLLLKQFFWIQNQSLNEIRLSALKIGKNDIGDKWYELGLSKKIETRDPSIDLNLLNFLGSLPKGHVFSRSRLLYDNNFKIFFSDELLTKKIRGIQSVDIKQRLYFENNQFINSIQENEHTKQWINFQRLIRLKSTNNREFLTNCFLHYQLYLFSIDLD